MCAMTQNISTMAQNLSIMTHNQNTIMEMLQKLRSDTNHISNSNMLDHYVNKNESNKIEQDNKQDKETKYRRDDQNTNNIFHKDELDQHHNESQASIIENKDNPHNDKRQILQYAKESKSKESDNVDSSSTLTVLPPWRNLNVTLSGDFECEKPQETSLLEITRKDNKIETLRDDILSIVGQVIYKTKLDMVSHKNIPRIHVHGK